MNPVLPAFNLNALVFWQEEGRNTNKDKNGEAMRVAGTNGDSGGQWMG